MAEKQIIVSYGALKLQALEFYMREEGNRIEDALKEHLEKLYQKNVPKQVQEFIEKGPLENDNVEEEAEEQNVREVPENQTETVTRSESGRNTQTAENARSQGNPRRGGRNSRRQNTEEEVVPQAEPVQVSGEEEQEQGEGMTMSM